MVVNNSVEKLQELGLSEYEARTYLSLLATPPVTAYELAKLAAIPTSKIYSVIRKLLARGLVQPLHKEGKQLYIPLQPREFLSRCKARLADVFTSLESELSAIQSAQQVSFLWNLQDYPSLIEKAGRMIAEAQHNLLLSVWQEEMNGLLPRLRQAEARGIKLAIVHFGRTEHKIGQLYPHPIERTIYSEKGGRGICLVTDGAAALVGTVLADSQIEGAWSINRGFVTLAEDYIKHDIYIMKIVSRFDKSLIRCFGAGYQKLRDIFSDEEEDHAGIH